MGDRFTERDPNRSTAQWEPAFHRVKPIGAEDHARKNRNASHMRERRCAWPKWRAFEKRLHAVTNAALGKKAHDAPVFQSFDRGANCLSISAVPLRRECIDGTQCQPNDRQPEKF